MEQKGHARCPVCGLRVSLIIRRGETETRYGWHGRGQTSCPASGLQTDSNGRQLARRKE